MFKRLKTRLIITYCISMLIIIIISFSAVFYVSYENYNRELKIKSEIRDNENGIGPNRDDIIIYNNEVIGNYNLNQTQLDEISNKINENKNYIKIDNDIYYISHTNTMIKLSNVTQAIYSLINLVVWLIILLILISVAIITIAIYLTNKLLEPVIKNYENQKKFVSDASHELKTPLQVLKNSLLLVKEDDDEKDKWIEYSLKETDRLTKLTSNLLTLSRDFDVNDVEEINLTDELHEFISTREVFLFEENYKLTYTVADNVYVKIHRDDVIQILTNLFDNAVKHSDKRKRIDIQLSSNRNEVNLKISNSSDYIGGEQIKLLSNRFYKIDDTHNSRNDSFGLGLSIVKKLLEKYNYDNRIYYDDSKFVYEIKFKN